MDGHETFRDSSVTILLLHVKLLDLYAIPSRCYESLNSKNQIILLVDDNNYS